MTCREFIGFLMDYLDGELPEEQRASFEQHLSICESCVAYMQTYLDTIKMGKAAFETCLDDPVPESVPEDLVRAILSARSNRAEPAQ